MRHGVDGRKLGRNTSHRKAMLKNLANAVIEKERVFTTLPKAKEARRVVDRWVTLGKAGTPHAQRIAFSRSRSKSTVKKLFSTLAERYEKRNGGYTRVLRVSDRRRGDGAELAMLELVDHPPIKRGKVASAAAQKAAEAKAKAQKKGGTSEKKK